MLSKVVGGISRDETRCLYIFLVTARAGIRCLYYFLVTPRDETCCPKPLKVSPGLGYRVLAILWSFPSRDSVSTTVEEKLPFRKDVVLCINRIRDVGAMHSALISLILLC